MELENEWSMAIASRKSGKSGKVVSIKPFPFEGIENEWDNLGSTDDSTNCEPSWD